MVKPLWVQVGDDRQPLLAGLGLVRSNLYSTLPLGLDEAIAVIRI